MLAAKTAIRLIAGFASLGLVGAGSAQAGPQPGDRVPGVYNCFFVDGPLTPSFEARSAASQANGRVMWIYPSFRAFSMRAPAAAVDRMLQKNPMIDHCSQAVIVSLPPEMASASSTVQKGPPSGGGGGGGGGGKTDTIPWGVAYVKGGIGYNGGKAWVVDTGVSASTGDLSLDAANSAVFLSVPNSIDGTSTQDYNGHGTHVAGTIAALKNGKAVVGVAPGAVVVPVKVLAYTGLGLDSDVAMGLQHVLGRAKKGDVANLSISGDVDSDLMDAAVVAFADRFVTAAGGPSLVIAAGNSTRDINDPDVRYSPPADIDGPGIYTVSAIDASGSWASFSNYGASVDYAEPGVDIVSLNTSGRTAKKSGTSMAAPHLVGILLSSGTPIVKGTTVDPANAAVDIGSNP
ncbi:S8 family serine peptidase [Croceicoccus sp. BE223]|uniref:S8 family serine peptidase n=1 Tax=Croceicoccus sp. BE223 TaxID=2817716 RepID=UPI0028619749|nr:S8 family serine peptidase [Croceicoccus sp. BE223]MDR7103147.1 subtilisin family serine protease [Croceicoccus sp. BE223]